MVIKPLDYVRYFAPAPGIVLIKSPGHTPGSQMICKLFASLL